jgi:hypothetical protein
MTELLYKFTPTSDDQFYLWLGIILAIVGFATSYYLLKKPATGRTYTGNSILAMLAFFVGMMAISTAFFSGWSLRKQGKIELYQEGIQLGADQIPYGTIRKIYFKQDKSASIFQAQGTTKTNTFLVIEQEGGKTHAISEEQFPIGEIMTRIKEITKKE